MTDILSLKEAKSLLVRLQYHEDVDSFVNIHYRFLEQLYSCKDKIYQIKKGSGPQNKDIEEFEQEIKEWIELLKELMKMKKYISRKFNQVHFISECKKHLKYFENKYKYLE